MPTQSTTYNSRVTDESLEKRFRDTFRSQGGAELVDDLYAQGVIVPVVDFTAAATGQQLSQNLQTSWDFSTGFNSPTGTGTGTLISTPGFWKVDWWYLARVDQNIVLNLNLYDGTTDKTVWEAEFGVGTTNVGEFADEVSQIIYLRSGDSLRTTALLGTAYRWKLWYRQIADVSGNLVNPTGFTSS